jgi:hypothetical protein
VLLLQGECSLRTQAVLAGTQGRYTRRQELCALTVVPVAAAHHPITISSSTTGRHHTLLLLRLNLRMLLLPPGRVVLADVRAAAACVRRSERVAAKRNCRQLQLWRLCNRRQQLGVCRRPGLLLRLG